MYPFGAVPARADAEPLKGSVLSVKVLRLEGVKADAPPLLLPCPSSLLVSHTVHIVEA